MSLLTQFYNCGGSGSGVSIASLAADYGWIQLFYVGSIPGVAPKGGNATYVSTINMTTSNIKYIHFQESENDVTRKDGLLNAGFTYAGTVDIYGRGGAGVTVTNTNGLDKVTSITNVKVFQSTNNISAPILLSIIGGNFFPGSSNSNKSFSAPNLTTFSASTAVDLTVGSGAGTFTFTTAFDADSLNNFLVSAVNNGGCSFAGLDLSGGTAAGTSSLTAAGTAAVAALVAGGTTVTLHP